MFSFAKVNPLTNIVDNVIFADDSFIETLNDNFLYVKYEDSMNGFPEAGGKYENGNFYFKQPFASWVWSDEKWGWYPPVDYPEDGQIYNWNEETLSWDLVTE